MPTSLRAWESFSDGVDKLADATSEACANELTRWFSANPGASRDEALRATTEIIERVGGLGARASSSLAQSFLDSLLVAAGQQPMRTDTDSYVASAHAGLEVGKHGKLLDDGRVEDFVRIVSGVGGDLVNHASNSQMMRNQGPIMYGRVPRGPHPCDWCIAVASQGAIYPDAATAGAFTEYHSHCRCKVIPTVDGKIEGVDYDHLLSVYYNNLSYKEQGYSETQRMALREGASKASVGDPRKGKPTGRPRNIVKASPVFLNKSTQLYRNTKKVKPIPGYVDVGIHSDGLSFWYTNADEGDRAKWTRVNAHELAEFIRSDPSWDGSPIRLLACRSGESPDGAAQMLANNLGVEIIAPTTDVCIDGKGNVALTNDLDKADSIIDGDLPDDGKWVSYKPKDT